jgi:hypothetical protein
VLNRFLIIFALCAGATSASAGEAPTCTVTSGGNAQIYADADMKKELREVRDFDGVSFRTVKWLDAKSGRVWQGRLYDAAGKQPFPRDTFIDAMQWDCD